MRLLVLSDIHGRYKKFSASQMPEADICIIAGDITNRGLRDTQEFCASQQWIADIVDRFPLTLWIEGNHDLEFHCDIYYPIGSRHEEYHRLECIQSRRYLLQNGAEILSLFGVSMSPAYDMPELASTWCNMTARREVEEAAYARIPHNTDIIVSHCPPFGIMDAAGFARNPDGTWEKRPIGSKSLLAFIDEHSPRIVICGHVHGAAGHVRYKETDIYNVAEEWRIIEV
ncbi:MAG: metallophosphoesterase family protein [Janthinobacterium lividum]